MQTRSLAQKLIKGLLTKVWLLQRQGCIWGEKDGGPVPSSRTKWGGQGVVHGTWRWRGRGERPDEDPACDLLARVTAGAGSPFLRLSPPQPFSLLLAARNQAQGQGARRCTVYTGQSPGCREGWRVDLGGLGEQMEDPSTERFVKKFKIKVCLWKVLDSDGCWSASSLVVSLFYYRRPLLGPSALAVPHTHGGHVPGPLASPSTVLCFNVCR